MAVAKKKKPCEDSKQQRAKTVRKTAREDGAQDRPQGRAEEEIAFQRRGAQSPRLLYLPFQNNRLRAARTDLDRARANAFASHLCRIAQRRSHRFLTQHRILDHPAAIGAHRVMRRVAGDCATMRSLPRSCREAAPIAAHDRARHAASERPCAVPLAAPESADSRFC